MEVRAAVAQRDGGIDEARVTVRNPGTTVAFFLRLQVVGARNEEALPVFWHDNHTSLMPGDTRTVSATYASRDLRRAPRVVIGWNVAAVSARAALG